MSVSLAVRPLPARPDPRAVLTLLKPVTWFPPMWAFACGAVSAGVPLANELPLLALGILLTGPLVCASSQAVNDWFDRHVDAINEPQRPIPSGRIPGRWGLAVAIGWTVLSMLAAIPLGLFGMAAVGVALLFSWAYSAPPVRLKQNGWFGNAAVGITYEGLAWITGAGIMLGSQVPSMPVLLMALLYSAGAHGIMTLNDFKAIDGDRRTGVRSLPVMLGELGAARVACAMMIVAQLAVITLLMTWARPAHAASVAVLVVVQLVMMRRFLAAPRERALWLSALGVPFYVSGMMITAFAIRALP
ncbi:MAG: chlorophyll synthase ChlG [Gemmatimonadota bacterium]